MLTFNGDPVGPASRVQARTGDTQLIVNPTGPRPLDDLAAVKAWID